MNVTPTKATVEPLLSVNDLQASLVLARGTLKAVDGVSFHVNRGETLGIVGESGSGKTLTSMSIIRLLPKPAGRIVGGSIMFDGVDLAALPEKDVARSWRGKRISMVLQDPLTSLNPVYTIADQLGQPFRYHHKEMSRSDIRDASIEMLRKVRIPAPETRLSNYPHQFSGGMRQRAVIAMAIAAKPELLIADEPTSALDVTIQIQIMDLFRKLQAETGVSIIMITHDMGVAAQLCDRVAVMYAGRIVEIGPAREIFKRPAHPYTQGLLKSIPQLGHRQKRLYAIPGQPPSLFDPPKGCRFAERCPHVMPKCAEYPPTTKLGNDHSAACWLLEGKQ
ncbi:MAG: ABC transporter ATP-binding protein [Mesorhizobium sp.]